MLDHSLLQLFRMCNSSFSLKTVLMIGKQVLRHLQYLHFKQYIHRDIQPENLFVGRDSRSTKIFTLSFVYAKKYNNSLTHEHIAFKDNKIVKSHQL